MKRVHLTAGDNSGWAIDEDLRLLRGSLAGECEFTSLARAGIVQAVWWQRLLRFSRRDFTGKHVLCYADNAPFHYASGPEFLKARALVTLWIARSREAVSQFATLGLESRFAPYTFDPAIFRPLGPDDAAVRALVEKWRIPTDRYLIANFHRDTEGGDRHSPKLQKGPDAFLEIVAQLHADGAPVHVLLAGPRRFFLRTQLARRGVPFSFVGEETGGRDDYEVNILPRATLNLLYQIADLHLVASRWEGGPHSVLEAAAARCKIVSTSVGIAPDVLAPECLFESVPEACGIIRRDVGEKYLDAFTDRHFQCAHEHHTEPALRRHLVEIYGSLEPLAGASRGFVAGFGASFRHLLARVRSRFPRVPQPLAIAVLHQPGEKKSASFDAMITQLGRALEQCGCTVTHNALTPATNGVLLGRLPSGDPLATALRLREKLPVVCWRDESDLADRDACACPREDATILPSIEALAALRQRGDLPAGALVLPPPPAEAPADSAGPLIIQRGDAWAAGRIVQALTQGRPVLYPADSHYRWLVWFAGIAYGAEEQVPQKLDTLRMHSALFARLIPPADARSAAAHLVRLFHVCRELISE